MKVGLLLTLDSYFTKCDEIDNLSCILKPLALKIKIVKHYKKFQQNGPFYVYFGDITYDIFNGTISLIFKLETLHSTTYCRKAYLAK